MHRGPRPVRETRAGQRACSGGSRCGQALRRVEHRRFDFHVAATAAQVARQILAHVLERRVRVLRQERSGGQDEAGRAKGALKGGVIEVRLLDQVESAIRIADAFDRDDRFADRQRRQQQAAADRLAIQQNGARAAHAHATGFAHAGQLELIAQNLQQRVLGSRAETPPLAVDLEDEPHRAVLVRRTEHGGVVDEAHDGWSSRKPRSTFSGVMGRSRMRTPVARYTALPTAGATGGRDVSPRPWMSDSLAMPPAVRSSSVMPMAGWSLMLGSMYSPRFPFCNWPPSKTISSNNAWPTPKEMLPSVWSSACTGLTTSPA